MQRLIMMLAVFSAVTYSVAADTYICRAVTACELNVATKEMENCTPPTPYVSQVVLDTRLGAVTMTDASKSMVSRIKSSEYMASGSDSTLHVVAVASDDGKTYQFFFSSKAVIISGAFHGNKPSLLILYPGEVVRD